MVDGKVGGGKGKALVWEVGGGGDLWMGKKGEEEMGENVWVREVGERGKRGGRKCMDEGNWLGKREGKRLPV